jgi:predicted dehydrogenase
MTFSVAVIGAGKIAAGFDSPGDPNVLTHLHAIVADPRFDCRGLYDTDSATAEAQARRWSVPYAQTFESLFEAPLDVAVIATPDKTHGDCLQRVLAHRPRIVLCEKPLTATVAEARAIGEAYRKAGVTLAVNFQRRYEETVVALKQALSSGQLGRPVTGAVWYSKGVLHNGSHAVDLLRLLFGEVLQATARRRTVDFYEADPTVSGTLVFKDVEIELIGADERLFSLFEVDLVFEKARYRYALSGTRLERFEVRPDPLFPGYAELIKIEDKSTALNRALAACYAAMAACLENGTLPATVAADALATQEVCAALQELPVGATWRPSLS